MDNLDQEILAILIKDARMPFSRLGKKLGISSDLAKKRYKKIMNRNPQLKTTVVLDSKKLGFNSMTGFYIILKNHESIQKVMTKLFNYSKTILLSECIGDFDLFHSIYMREFKDFQETMDYLERFEEIKEVQIQFPNKDENINFPLGNELLIYEVE